MNLEILHPDIFYYKNVIPNPEELIDMINSTDILATENSLIDKWMPFHAPSRPDAKFGLKKISNVFRDGETHEDLVVLYKTVFQYISKTTKDYAEKRGLEPGYQDHITFLKYFENTFLGPHTDSQPDKDGHISCVIYLNDNYEGGELRFNNHNITIKPEAGSIFVFPSQPPFVHQSLSVKSGEKYLITAFWHTEKVAGMKNMQEQHYD